MVRGIPLQLRRAAVNMCQRPSRLITRPSSSCDVPMLGNVCADVGGIIWRMVVVDDNVLLLCNICIQIVRLIYRPRVSCNDAYHPHQANRRIPNPAWSSPRRLLQSSHPSKCLEIHRTMVRKQGCRLQRSRNTRKIKCSKPLAHSTETDPPSPLVSSVH